jgi:TonB family protein
MRNWNNDIERYKKGELTAAEMHALEKQALTDPFLADALEGAAQIATEDFVADVRELNDKVAKKHSASPWIWPLRMAAGVALILVVSYLINTFRTTTQEKQSLSLQKQLLEPEHKINPEDVDSLYAKGQSTSSEQTRIISQSKPKNTGNQAASKLYKPIEEALAMVDTEEETDQTKNEEKKVEIAATEITKEEKAVALTPQPNDNNFKQKLETDALLKKKALATPETQQATLLQKDTVAQTISGKVISAEDGSPLPGVNVVINGTTMGTVTDVNGNYQLQSPVGQPELLFSFIGLKSKQIQVVGNKADVSLEIDTSQLSEVVVVGYGVDRDENYTPIVKKAEPVGGLKAYNRYLDNDARYPLSEVQKKIKGRVSLKFTVKPDGRLDEFKIVKSLGKLFDEEALRMVKEGPAWNPTTEDNVPIESEVLVRVKFDPSKAGQ